MAQRTTQHETVTSGTASLAEVVAKFPRELQAGLAQKTISVACVAVTRAVSSGTFGFLKQTPSLLECPPASSLVAAYNEWALKVYGPETYLNPV